MADASTASAAVQLRDQLLTHRCLQEKAIAAWYAFSEAQAEVERSIAKIVELTERAHEERGQ
ncbi:hypothetical protein SEA_REYNAULD_13 [Rhodococcus phage Reynauld]|uniref:Uncharacterized protein n=1 Tax=Rhodococcus phage Reynauld TaxID=3062845 RepID=A0ACD4UH26_9CAUD|nr:hypothetical protein SEA_REYNAULD_13 [Rhodococcus phage Reynauld]